MYIQTRIKNGNPPAPTKGIRLAICQPQGGLSGSKEAIAKSLKVLKEKAMVAKNEYKAQLISFPELFLSGYAFENNETAHNICLSVDEAVEFFVKINSVRVKFSHKLLILCIYLYSFFGE